MPVEGVLNPNNCADASGTVWTAAWRKCSICGCYVSFIARRRMGTPLSLFLFSEECPHTSEGMGRTERRRGSISSRLRVPSEYDRKGYRSARVAT